MSRGMPSLTALLGMLALAGYQNKDKIAEMLGGLGGASGGAGGQGGGFAGGAAGRGGALAGGTAGGSGGMGGLGGLGGLAGPLGGLLGGLGGAGAGGLLGGGLGELLERFKETGHDDHAESWVGSGPNKPMEPHQLERAIGPDVLQTLTQQTGLSREELLSRLSRELPDAVDRYTPDGRVPDFPGFGRS